MEIEEIKELVENKRFTELKSKLAEMNVAMTRNIASQSKTFGDCKEQLLKWPNILKKIQAEYKIDLSDYYDILPTSEAMLAITYMSLDFS